jgi:hypothetical protein
MFHWFASRGISAPLAVALVALGVFQLSLQIWAVIDLIKRPAPTQRKVVAALVIVLAGLVGAVAYLAVGRSMLDEEAASGRTGRVGAQGNEDAKRRALDRLYGPDDRK